MTRQTSAGFKTPLVCSHLRQNAQIPFVRPRSGKRSNGFETRCSVQRALLSLVLAGAVLSSALVAEETPALSLLRPDSLTGWDHAGTQGWSISDGTLTGKAGADRLLSGWTVGDFELTLKYRLEGDITLRLELPRVGSQGKSQKAIELTPQDDAQADKLRTLVVSRKNQKYTVVTDGEAKAIPAPEPRVGLALAVSGDKQSQGRVVIESITLREPAGRPLFNGRDLTGWWTPGKLDAWQVEDGAIVKRNRGGNYLRTEQEFGNYTLSLDYKIAKGGNSGIGIRTPRKGWPSSDGMELQILDRQAVDKSSTMSIYRNVAPLAVAHKSGEWNHCVVKADGYMISAWINGTLVQHFNTRHHPELKHRNLAGWIGFQDHGAVTHFRNINILPAPAGESLTAWREPPQRRGAERVLNRLLNPEQLALDDRLRTETYAGQLKDEKQVLAEITGPGALVRADLPQRAGRVEFYFDGEEKPRISCDAKDLAGATPLLSKDKHPVLTYVAFAKSLRVECEAGKSKSDRYALDVVRLPQDTVVETFADKKQSIPRGWLAPIDYRHHHHRRSTVRNFAPHEQLATSPKTTIEPGSSAELVHLEGAGQVEWIRLKCDDAVLNSDALWLDITLDGEDLPAISCPARFLLAPIRDNDNYHNFVALDTGGRLIRLVMPYGAGLRVTARNEGDKPLGELTFSARYRTQADTGTDFAARMRLRGQFIDEPAAKVSGPGRLVALVCGAGEGDTPKIDTLSTDGQAVAGWSQATLQQLLGGPAKGETFRANLSGRDDQLAWRYLWLAPLEFEKSLEIRWDTAPPAGQLWLYYAR